MAPEKVQFSVYFSHSGWAPDVDLNLFVWKAISEDCKLLVDHYKDDQLPWYVNRIEDYIRRSDLFLAALTCREPAPGAKKPRAHRDPFRGDEDVRCSAASLFEVRLAERARKPRLVLYEKGTRFRPSKGENPLVKYVPYERNVILEQGGSLEWEKIENWLSDVRKRLTPRTWEPNQWPLILLPSDTPDRADILKAIQDGLDEADYNDPRVIDDVSTDAEILDALANSSLLVADLTALSLKEIYAMAHALFLPCIRLIRSYSEPKEEELPWLLRGHPYGYQKDLVVFSDFEDLQDQIFRRAKAMRDTRRVLRTYDEGRAFFLRNRYKPHRVFLSHNLKGPDRPVIDAIARRLQDNAINFWEYKDSQRSGEQWKQSMGTELGKATHVIAVMGEGYENSEYCLDEIQALLGREKPVQWLPYLWNRTNAVALLSKTERHQDRLRQNPEEAALQVFSTLADALGAGS